MAERVRLDKWLWAARLYKTRAMAAQATALGRVSVNGVEAKASREPKVGDRLTVRQAPLRREFDIKAISDVRGPAPVARLLYEETPDSIAERERLIEQRRAEPAAAREAGRPTKRERRDLAQWDRWSASLDDTER